MKRRWKKFLAGVLSAALALNLAAPLALAGNSTIGAACSVTSVFLYPEYVGRVDGENVSCIQGEVSYDHGLLTFHGDVTLTTVGVADLGTVPLVKALSEKNLRLVANGKVTGRTKGNGIEEAKEIAGGEYDLTYADLGAYLDTKPNGILGGDTGTTITAGTEITLKDFHTGIGGGDVRIDGTVNITGAMFEGATYGIANFTTMNPGSELEIHADRYIRKNCILTYNGGHLLMIVAENGDGNNIVQGRLSIGNDVSRFWYRTDENERIEKAIIENNARLVIIDPIQAYLGADVDMNRANEVRPIFMRLGQVAQRTGCAILLIGHLNKAAGMQSLQRGLGSIDIAAAVRSVMFIGKLKHDPTMRILTHEKSSLAPPGVSLAFSLGDEGGFRWIGEYDITADEMLSGIEPQRETKTQQAKDLICTLLAGGKQVLSEDIDKAALERGIPGRTVRDAKRELGDALKSKIVEGRKKVFWME